MSLRKRALNTNLIQRKVGATTTEKLAAGQALQLGNGAANTRKYKPLAYMPVTVAEGQAISAELNLVPPMPIPQSVTITMDTLSLGTAANKHKITLFDQAKFNRTNDSSLVPPAGVVYIGSQTENYYDSFVQTMCSSSYHIIGLTISVHAYDQAAATEAQQLREVITRLQRDWVDNSVKTYNPAHYKECSSGGCGDNEITFSCVGNISRIDQFVAWCYNAYEGMRIDFTFHLSAKAKDV